jgi:hypothetical protein
VVSDAAPASADSSGAEDGVESQAISAAVEAAIADLIPEGLEAPRVSEATATEGVRVGVPDRVDAEVADDTIVVQSAIQPVNLEASVPNDHEARTGEGAPVAPLDLSVGPETFPRPTRVRGIYVNAWAAGSTSRSQRLVALAGRTEINAFVVDLKDATGFISYPTGVPLAQEIGADQEIRIRDLPALLKRLRSAGIYPIARIVIAKDPILTEHRPEWAVQDVDGGVWADDKGVSWANMFDGRVWEYNISLAREAAAMGFPEIQWDYLRFPDGNDSVMSRAVYPGAKGRERPDAVRAFLEYAEGRLRDFDIAMTADVFGVTTAARHDLGIGQIWERFIDRVDAALPMVYPSHYGPGSYGFEKPNAHPYEIVRAALTDARNRSDTVVGAGRTRPWLQDFTLGSPRYGGPEVRAQIQAAYDTGIQEWILWNPSVRYSEAGLLPAGGMPRGTEPTMLLGGKVIPVSRRLELLDGGLVSRIAERRLAPLVLPMPMYLGPRRVWAGRVDGN